MPNVRAVLKILIAFACAMSALFPCVASADTTGSVRGFIHCIDCEGWPPIAGATVTVSGQNGTWNATTDAHGFYVIFAIAPGRYNISVFDHHYRYTPQLLHSVHPLCVHAGDFHYLNLYLGHSLADPYFKAYQRAWNIMQFEPDASQTADVYSLGDC